MCLLWQPGNGKEMKCCVLCVFFAEPENGKKRNVACWVTCLFWQNGNGKEMKCCVLCFFSADKENEKKRNVAVACCVSPVRKLKAKLNEVLRVLCCVLIASSK